MKTSNYHITIKHFKNLLDYENSNVSITKLTSPLKFIPYSSTINFDKNVWKVKLTQKPPWMG